MSTIIHTFTVLGVDAVPVTVEVDLLRRLPSMVIVGLPGGAVRESAVRVRSAIEESGLPFPRQRVVVNVGPTDLRKAAPPLDLPIAVGILAADGEVEVPAGTALVGELALDGRLRPVRGITAMAEAAVAAGLATIVVPVEHLPLLAHVHGIDVVGCATLAGVVGLLRGEVEPLYARDVRRAAEPPQQGIDMADVRGQARARRALEVAAAGGHNLRLTGSPGAGKTMLAARLPTILPTMTSEEVAEVTRIHDVAGLLRDSSATRRPFRAPHHTVGAAGLVGSASLRPGEATLAHNGVLFLDELPEFGRQVLECLRPTLDDGEITIARASNTVTMPANFSLVVTSNPCPCGFLGHPRRACVCSESAIERFRARLDSPTMARVDIHVRVESTAPSEPSGESSATVRARVEAARARRAERGIDLPLSDEARADLNEAVAQLQLGAAGWNQAARVASTIADLAGADAVQPAHVDEALYLCGGAA